MDKKGEDGGREGICLFCERKESCTYRKPENGPIECDEYEEMPDITANFSRWLAKQMGAI